MIDIKNLEPNLEKLTGLDYEACLKRSKTLGDTSAIPQLSTTFQLELAAKALGVNSNELKTLPLKKFAQVISTVQLFLTNFSDEDEVAAE